VADRILVCGNPDDRSVSLVIARCASQGLTAVMLSQRRFATSAFEFEIGPRGVTGSFSAEGRKHHLEEFGGIYVRMAEDHRLPELARESAVSPVRRRAQHWRDGVNQWADVAPARVVNRPSAVASHCSRPLQSQVMVRHGFHVPETLVTTEPELAIQFFNRHPQVLCTAASGVKPPPRMVTVADLAKLERIRWCPAQFQEWIEGREVRVHVIGNEVFATGLSGPASDRRDPWPAVNERALYALKPSDDLAAQSITLAMDLDLPFASLDLKITADDRVYCLEVHPTPDFSDCETKAGQPISTALVRYLSEQK
jgi:glutathione synthase/RimK-type ligase-like ATP-grasp enzyme